ncbi:MAG TPA: preprotein translocase subunit SecE [Thermosulfidibacter takaii]|uniref:Protein translocase subunit SecE n=1 Tax=Thermosulfidibacter takaii TaxID=412593 RepID=A0A7C0Y7Y2_9BACT|nr:preprotein translocase subunit SecE [Thermosulfidibacter takaii]
MLEKFRAFLREVKSETRRVVFPSRKQTVQASIGVMLFSAFVAFYLGLLDFLFARLISKLLTF